MINKTIDYTPLDKNISLQEAKDQHAELVAKFKINLAAPAILAAMSLIIVIYSISNSDIKPLFFAAVMPIIGIFIYIANRLKLKSALRMAEFARINDFGLVLNQSPNEKGVLFQNNPGTNNRAYSQGFLIHDTARTMVANYSYGGGRNFSALGSLVAGNAVVSGFDVSRGIIRIVTTRQLPHLLIAAKNGGLGNAITSYANTKQKLRIDDEFNSIFDVHLLDDAVNEFNLNEVFTPQLKELLKSKFSSCDIELVEDKVIVYSKAPFKFTGSEFPKIFERASELSNFFSADQPNEITAFS